MKLRRALAAAATTAVIAPIALLSAPAAFATDETPAPTVSESTPAAEPTPTDEESTPATDEPAPTGDATTPATEEPTPTEDATTPATEEPTPTEEPTASASPSPSESTPEDEEGDGEIDECPVGEDGEPVVDISDVLHTSLSGLPEKVVAGSGWTNFKFNVRNSSDQTIEDVAPIVGVAAMDWGLENDYNHLVTVQVKRDGAWVDIATQFGEGGVFSNFDLGGGQSISYDLRVSISRDVPSAVGIAVGLAEYSDDEACWLSEDENFGIYYFEVLPAGSNPGKPNDSKPQTGGKEQIDDVKEVEVTGSLAETGSSSDLPVIATIGGVAVLAGAGVVFAMKRRKVGAQA